jgi:hypothetical protein
VGIEALVVRDDAEHGQNGVEHQPFPARREVVELVEPGQRFLRPATLTQEGGAYE